MGRRTRRRWVSETPNNFYFSEENPKLDDCVIISVAEFEAMRLKHYMKLDQQRSAERMGISQPTFSRVLDSAHQKITQALIYGKVIQVYGGNIDYKKKWVGYGCLSCKHEWEDRTASKEKKVNCIKCNSPDVYFFVREVI